MCRNHSPAIRFRLFIGYEFPFSAQPKIAEQAAEAEPIIYPDPEDERDVYEHQPLAMPSTYSASFGNLSNGGIDEQQFIEMLSNLNRGNENSPVDFAAFTSAFTSAGPGGMPNDPLLSSLFGAQMPSSEPKAPDSPLKKFLGTKFHIAALAVFTYLLVNTSSISCNVFLLFLLWEIVEIFILRQHEIQSNSMFSAFLMMAGISPTKLNVFIKWIQLINKVLRDIAVFLFSFVFTHIIYTQLTGRSSEEIIGTIISNSPVFIQPNDDIDDDPFEFVSQ